MNAPLIAMRMSPDTANGPDMDDLMRGVNVGGCVEVGKGYHRSL